MRFRALFGVRLAVVVSIAAVLLAAGSAAGGASTESAKPKQGGTATLLFNSEPPGMDPAQLREIGNITPAMISTSIFDELVYQNIETLKIVPKIATSLTTPDKGLTWVLKLHSGVQFSDGTAYDAAAVQYNWQRFADPATRAAFAAVPQQIASYEIVDPLTLKVTLKAPDALYDKKIARNIAWIGSPTALKADPVGFQTKPVGAGPYLLKEWIRSVSTTYVRYPNYWQKGRPYIDTIITKFVNEDTARANTLMSGGASAALEGSYTNIQQYEASGKYTVVHTPAAGGGYGFGMNLTKAPFDDLRVRQAMALTLDATELTTRSQYGGPADAIKTVDLKSSPFYDKNQKLPKSDPAAAQKLIDSYIADKNGGKPIEFTYLSLGVPNFIRMGEAVQALIASRLKNVTVKIEVQDPTTAVGRWTRGDFQASQFGPRWVDPSLDDPIYFQTGASQNYTRYSNPAVDAAIDRMTHTADQKVIAEAQHTITDNVLKDLPIVWIVRANVYWAIEKAALGGWQMFYELRPLIEDVHLKKPNA